MADGNLTPQGDEESREARPQPEMQIELCDSLPGGRAFIGVEQEGSFVWLASKEHISEQGRDELVELFRRVVRERWWVQNWPGAS
jgi:hypothetical protein